MDGSYAGDVTPRTAWETLENDPNAVLIDVRTAPEWTYVGLPDLSSIKKETMCICWQEYPAMEINDDFVEDVEKAGVTPDQTIMLLCRSGVRSRHAAVALTARGFAKCFNVTGGFEGNHNEERHRGTRDGWKVEGLPWQQN